MSSLLFSFVLPPPPHPTNQHAHLLGKCTLRTTRHADLVPGILKTWQLKSIVSPNKSDIVVKHNHDNRWHHTRPRMPNGHRRTICMTDLCQVSGLPHLHKHYKSYHTLYNIHMHDRTSCAFFFFCVIMTDPH